jgi:hypothetical protein
MFSGGAKAVETQPQPQSHGITAAMGGLSLDEPSHGNPPGSQAILAKVLYEYAAEESNELSLAEGDEIEIHDMGTEGWSTGRNKRTGEEGTFPSESKVILDTWY